MIGLYKKVFVQIFFPPCFQYHGYDVISQTPSPGEVSLYTHHEVKLARRYVGHFSPRPTNLTSPEAFYLRAVFETEGTF